VEAPIGLIPVALDRTTPELLIGMVTDSKQHLESLRDDYTKCREREREANPEEEVY
jgi:hypothetical protein